MEDVKFIGVYSSRENAQEAIERLPVFEAIVVSLVEIRMIAEMSGLCEQRVDRLRGDQQPSATRELTRNDDFLLIAT